METVTILDSLDSGGEEKEAKGKAGGEGTDPGLCSLLVMLRYATCISTETASHFCYVQAYLEKLQDKLEPEQEPEQKKGDTAQGRKKL
jgi:hypothetical protein